MRLNQILSREKDLAKSLKGDTKSLKKALKKAQKGKIELSSAQIRDQLDGLLEETAEFFKMGATRTWADAQNRVDVVVDGTTLLTDVPIAYLILAEKQLKYLRDLLRYIPLDSDSPRLDQVGSRIEKLHNAVRFARQEANASVVDEPPYGQAMIEYIMQGQTAEEPIL